MSATVRQLTATEYAATQDAVSTPADERPTGIGALETTRGNLPLQRLEIRARVSGLTAEIELVQGFHNPYPEPLEATYLFPLPDRAAVTGMRMHADDRTIDGVLSEREEARKTYDQAIARGQRASITEEERPDIFTMRVGNIVPAEQVTVTLRLATQLGFEDGVATLRFPLVVAPRFIPGEPLARDPVGGGVSLDTDAVPDASRITPPVLLPGCPNPIDLAIRADIDPAGLPMSEVTCSLHPVAVNEQPGGHTSVDVHPGERADRDFILRLKLAAEDAISTGLVTVPDPSDSGEQPVTGGTFALTVLPPTRTTPPHPRDVVLVLDRSGSMSGWKMVCARRAAGRIIDSLTSRDRFTVLTFDTTVETPADMPAGLVNATDRHRFRAVEHLAGLQARGGTQLLDPLLQAAGLLAEPAPDEQSAAAETHRERTLVLVTDGQVGNEDQILAELTDRLSGTRVHTVGIDRAINESFLRRLATLGGGRTELVESEEHLDAAMEAIHRRVAAPVVTDVELTAAGLELVPDTIVPRPLPALYAGAPLFIHGRYGSDSTAASAGSITITGQHADGTSWQESTPTTSSAANQAHHAIWARARIRDLEDRYVTARRGRDRQLGQLEREIVDTSLRFGVLSRFTAFVAVDERVVNEGGQSRRVTQPVETPHGWEPPARPTPAQPITTAAGSAEAAGSPPAARGTAPAMLAHHPKGRGGPGPRSNSTAAGGAAPGGGVASGGVASGGVASGGVARQGFAPPRRGGEPTPRPVAEPEELRALRASMEAWRTRLHQASQARPELLAELAQRLPTLADDAGRAGAETATVRPLRELCTLLHTPLPLVTSVAHLEFERRWLQALDVVEAFCTGPGAGSRRGNDHGPGSPAPSAPGTNPPPGPHQHRGTFWKRGDT